MLGYQGGAACVSECGGHVGKSGNCGGAVAATGNSSGIAGSAVSPMLGSVLSVQSTRASASLNSRIVTTPTILDAPGVVANGFFR